MNLVPRHDEEKKGLLGIKSMLANSYNKTLLQSWLESESKHNDKIYIGSHDLDCAGVVKEDRYWDKRNNRYDGIHLLGVSGRKDYTESVLKIFKRANILKHPVPKSSTYSRNDTDEHTDCPQAQYQRRKYSDVVSGYSYRVPTNNRFNPLNY